MKVSNIDLAALSWVRAMARDGTARRIRQAADVSTLELAHEVGVSAATISRWETGRRRPVGERGRKYAAVLLALQSEESWQD